MTSEADPSKCHYCGTPLDGRAPQGMCPRCLLGSGAAASTLAGSAPDAAVPPALDEVQALLPQFKFVELIGHGGMGAVYQAEQPALERTVAIKLLFAGGSDPEFAARFQREAQALAALDHPNIVTLHDFGQTGRYFYFVMEYVEAGNLAGVIRSGGLPVTQSLRIVIQICEALEYAHAQGVVHRDIKPGNILLNKQGRVKIADFGVAKLLRAEPDELFLTRMDQAVGTPLYMAPEQRDHPLEVDHRADIYSLGVVFYELLTGKLPAGRYPAPSQRVRMDVRLDEVVLRALESEPEARYQSAREVKTDIEATGRKGGAKEPRPEQPKDREPNRRTALLAGTLVVLGVGVATLALLPKKEEAAPPLRAGAEFELPQPAGRVVVWGSDVYGELDAVPELTEVVAVTTGGNAGGHSLALRRNGTVVAWGRNEERQSEVPPGLARVTAIAQGYAHNLALTAEGELVCWGRTRDGQCSPPKEMKGVIAIAAHGDVSGAIDREGKLFLWGREAEGRLRPPEFGEPVRRVALGRIHALALTESGTLHAWGDNHYGAAGLPERLEGLKQISAANNHNAVLHPREGVYIWGGSNVQPQRRFLEGSYREIATGFGTTVAIREDGTVVAWGELAPYAPPSLRGVVAAAVGRYHGVLVTTEKPRLAGRGRLRLGEPLATFGDELGVVHALALSPDGETMAAVSGQHLRLYSLNDYGGRGGVTHDEMLWDVAFSGDGATVACVSAGGEVLFAASNNPAGWRSADTLAVEGAASAVAFDRAEGSERVAVGTAEGAILLCQTGPGGASPVACRSGHEKPVVDLAFSRDGGVLYSASWDGTVGVWDAATGLLKKRLRLPYEVAISSLDLSRGGKLLSFTDWDGYVSVRDLSGGEFGRRWFAHAGGFWTDRLSWLGEKDSLTAQCALAEDGRLLITSGCDHEVRIWSVESGQMLGKLPDQTSAARAIALTPDGERLITTGHGQRLRVWNLEALLPEDW